MNNSFALHLKTEFALILASGTETYSLDIQQKLRNILFHVGNSRKLVIDAVNSHPGYCCPQKRAKKNPPQSITQGNPKAPFQRLGEKKAIIARNFPPLKYLCKKRRTN